MEYSEDEPFTPRFGLTKDNAISLKNFFSKRTRKSSTLSTTNDENKDKHKKNEKNKIKNEEKSKNKSKEKNKSKSREKGKNKCKSSKSKKKYSSGNDHTDEKNCENPFENFMKKKIELRNDFDQNNSEKFLTEKELAFQQFEMNENADKLDEQNNHDY